MLGWKSLTRKKKTSCLRMAYLILAHQESSRSTIALDVALPIRSKARYATTGNPQKAARNHLNMLTLLRSFLSSYRRALNHWYSPVSLTFYALFPPGRVETPYSRSLII